MVLNTKLWVPPPAHLVLAPDEIHVWRVPLDQPSVQLQRLTQTLSADERTWAEGLYFTEERQRFILERGLLRTLLGKYVGVPPNQLVFRYNCPDKPTLVQMQDGGYLRFTVSHSQDLSLYAFAYDRAIGVDLEAMRSIDVKDVTERFFSKHEYALLQTLPAHQKLEGVFHCLTRKEAYVKARGDSIAQPLDRFVVSLTPGEPAALLSVSDGPHETAHWSLQELTVGPGYVAALAVEGHDWRLVCLHWSE